MDLVTEADHAGKGSEIVQAYNASELKRENDLQLAAYTSHESKGDLHEDLQVRLTPPRSSSAEYP